VLAVLGAVIIVVIGHWCIVGVAFAIIGHAPLMWSLLHLFGVVGASLVWLLVQLSLQLLQFKSEYLQS